MPRLDWYWHRLQSMDASEVAMHWRRKFMQASERISSPNFFLPQTHSHFPVLPSAKDAPDILLKSLRERAEEIVKGEWKFFGHHLLKMDDPPNWHRDYLGRIDVATGASGFNLDHRELPSGADIKLVWELSRWHHLARLAQAGWLFNEK